MQLKNNVLLLSMLMSSYIFGQCINPVPGTPVWTLAADALREMCTIESKVCDLQSAIDGDFAGTFTVYDLILEKACNNLTTSEEIDSSFDELEVDLPPTISKLCVIESKVLALEDDVQNINNSTNDGIFTALDGLQTTLCSKIEQVSSELTQVQNTITNITQSEIDNTATILSKLDVLDDQVDDLNSALDVLSINDNVNSLDSCTDVLVSLADNLLVDVCDLESAVEVGFDGTFTALDAQLVKACDLVSLADVMDPTVMADFTGVFTSLDELQETVCTIESLVDIVCLINTEQLLCTAGSKIDLALAKICTAESVIDPLSSVADVVISTLEQVDEQAIVDVCSNIEEAISLVDAIESKVDNINVNVDMWQVEESFSQLEVIDQTLLTVCSKLDAIDVMDSKLCEIDSKLDVVNQEALTIESVVDEINTQADVVDSKIDTLGLLSQADFIESKVCNILDDTFTICSNVDELIYTLSTVESKVDYIIENMPNFDNAAYIVRQTGDDVAAFNIESNTTEELISVGNGPLYVAFSPDGTRAYVGVSSAGFVAVIDTDSRTVIDTIPMFFPTEIAITPDGAFAYVTNSSTIGQVRVVNLATNTIDTTISVGAVPIGIAITPDGAFAYVVNRNSNSVSVIDTSTNTVSTTIGVNNNPEGIAITPDGEFAYVTNLNSFNVSVIRIATNTVTATISVSPGNPAAIAITPDGAFAYVARRSTSTIAVIDTATNTVTATIPVGTEPRDVAITLDGAFVYVSNFADNTISIIDTGTNTVVNTIFIGGGPYGIAMQPYNKIDAKVRTIESKICLIDAQPLESKIEVIESLVCTIESNMDVANSLIDDVNIKAINLEGDFASTWTILDTIEQKLCISESILETVNSKLDNVDLSVDLSGVFTTIDTILLKECTIDSKTDVAISLADIFIAGQGDLSGTFTALDALLMKVCTIDSQTDVLDSKVDTLITFCGVPIYNSDLPLTISTSGRYFVAEPLVYAPAGTGTNAITIATSNVTLDLNGYDLTQTSGQSGTASTQGIVVSSSLNNIRILNGTVHDLTSKGVSINSGCSNILVRDINVFNTGTTGASGFAGDNGIDCDTGCSHIIIDNCNTRCTVDVGIFLVGSSASPITNSIIRNSTAGAVPTSSAMGIQSPQNCVITKCHGANVTDKGAFLQDFGTSFTANSIIEKGIFNDGRGGTLLSGVGGCVVQDCLMITHTQANVLFLFDASENVVINNTCSNGFDGIALTALGQENNYIVFNDITSAERNGVIEVGSVGANTYLGNFVGNSGTANYSIAGASVITGKFSTVLQTSSFIDPPPTKWTNIDMS